jgi:hypothetical protein
MKKHAAPILAAILLLLPLLYVVSYLALVKLPPDFAFGSRMPDAPYRIGGRWAQRIFWPLEQIDRKVRPKAWDPFFQGLADPSH